MRGARVMIWMVAALTAACGGRKSSAPIPDPAAPTGPGIAGLPACQAMLRSLDAAEACAPTPDERALLAYLNQTTRDLYGATAPIEPDTARAHAQSCILRLEDQEAVMRLQGCAFTLTTTEAAWIAALRARRTAVPASVTGEDRASLVALAAMRERTCACKDVACAEKLAAELDSGVLKPVTQPAARDAGGTMIDELMACTHRLRTAEMVAQGRQPSDPAGARQLLAQMKAANPEPVPPAPAADQVALPDGKVLRPADCPTADAFDREECLGLFTDVGACRALPEAERAACETRTIAEYVEAQDFGSLEDEVDVDNPTP